jgi:predicted RNA-binding Zn-ribbon protein involved in translation (DUF1610 family)
MNEDQEKAKKFIKLSMKQQLNDGEMEVTLYCPTCYEMRTGKVEVSIVEKIGEGQVIINQCDKCRRLGRKINLESLKAVLSGERLPLPDIDENYSLSDLVDDLLKKTNLGDKKDKTRLIVSHGKDTAFDNNLDDNNHQEEEDE